MATTFQLTAAKTCEGGVDVRVVVNGVAHPEGRVFASLAAALAAVDDNPWAVDDLLWIVRRCARARNLTLAQIRAMTLTVDFTSANVVTFA